MKQMRILITVLKIHFIRMKFAFRKSGKATKNLNLLKPEDVEIARMLISQGYTKSDLPISKPAKKNFREADLRNTVFKWDTIIRKDS